MNFHAAHAAARTGEWRKPPLIAKSFGRGADKHDAILKVSRFGFALKDPPCRRLLERRIRISRKPNVHRLWAIQLSARQRFFERAIYRKSCSPQRFERE